MAELVDAAAAFSEHMVTVGLTDFIEIFKNFNWIGQVCHPKQCEAEGVDGMSAS